LVHWSFVYNYVIPSGFCWFIGRLFTIMSSLRGFVGSLVHWSFVYNYVTPSWFGVGSLVGYKYLTPSRFWRFICLFIKMSPLRGLGWFIGWLQICHPLRRWVGSSISLSELQAFGCMPLTKPHFQWLQPWRCY